MLVEAPKSVIERYMKCPGSFRMVREGEEEAWMATHRIGETGLSDSGPSTRSVSYGVHGTSLAASNFLYCSLVSLLYAYVLLLLV